MTLPRFPRGWSLARRNHGARRTRRLAADLALALGVLAWVSLIVLQALLQVFGLILVSWLAMLGYIPAAEGADAQGGETVRVALYARVSTRDKDQNPDTQLVALREYAQAQGHEVIGEWVDTASARDMRGRAAWRGLLAAARARSFQAVLVLRLDRGFRSVADLHHTLAEWEPLGIRFSSLREGFDTTSALGRLLMNMLASLAEFELELIRERIADGLTRARGEGKRLGRPPGKKDSQPRRTSGYRIREAQWARVKGQ